jgi:hypothetical protein
MNDVPPPEELDTPVPGKQCGVEFQLFTSLRRFQPTNNFGLPISDR